jgi:hypothetical protein
MANVVIGKMGRTIYFNRDRWGASAGNNEAPVLFSTIAKMNPNNTYYLIGKSDFSRVSDEVRAEWFPHNNIIDCWVGWNSKEHDPTTWIWEQLKDIDIEYGVIHGGMSSLSIPGRIYCLDRKTGLPNDQIRKPIQSLVNYCSPITYYLNESGINWMTITSDGRYMPLPARDIINPEKISLGVKEGVAEFKRMKSYEDQVTMVEHKTELRYAAAEFQYLLDTKISGTKHGEEKTQKIALFFHQYDNKKRIKAITEIVDAFGEDEICVYGKWDNEIYTSPKYKGSVSYDDLQELLPHVKYTFCYPIVPGDISAKWVEAARAGIIPFLHESYDSDRLLVKYHNIPEWVYVKSAEEMKQKIEYLEANPMMYVKLKNIFVSAVSPGKYYSGAHFVNAINRAAKDMKKM